MTTCTPIIERAKAVSCIAASLTVQTRGRGEFTNQSDLSADEDIRHPDSAGNPPLGIDVDGLPDTRQSLLRVALLLTAECGNTHDHGPITALLFIFQQSGSRAQTLLCHQLAQQAV